MFSDFKKFVLRGNVVDLAVAVVIGVAFNALIHSLVNNMITPLITAIVGGRVNFGNLSFGIGKATFDYGTVINDAISFFLIAAVVYWFIVAPSAKLTALANRNKAAADRQCPECTSTIPIAAKRCMYCTAQVPQVETQAEAPAPRRARHGYFAPE